MDPTVAKIIEVGLAERHSLSIADHALAMRRLADTTLHGLKTIESITAKELLVSDDPLDVVRYNTAAVMPGTLPSYPAGTAPAAK